MLLRNWETATVWPDETGRALLRAALAKDADFPAAWVEARKVFRVETATLGHQRLLPLLYQRMVDAELNDPWRERFKGVYRNAWVVNQRVFKLAREAAAILDRAGLPFLAIKGLPLAHEWYENPTHRPMEDCDLLVREADAGRAIAAFLQAGWRTSHGGRWWDTLHQVRHSVDLTPDGLTHLDLHWHYIPGAVCEAYEAQLWQDTISRTFLGREWRLPAAEDQFVHALVHGMARNPVATLRWAVDAARLLQDTPDFRWEQVVSRSRQLRVVLPVREPLRYLRQELGWHVPTRWSDALAAIPIAARDREAFAYWSGARARRTPVRTFREEYLRATRLVPAWHLRRRWVMWRGLIMLQTGHDQLVPAVGAHLHWAVRVGWKHGSLRPHLRKSARFFGKLRKATARWLQKKQRDLRRKRDRYHGRFQRLLGGS
jgi:hypothetical protein